MSVLRVRVIPALLLRGESLVKTVRFSNPRYVGDPVNTCRIFNELEVDELMMLDIAASREGRGPRLEVLEEVANECFMPMAFGGGVSSLAMAERIHKLGAEKVVLNTAALRNPALITEIATALGSQSVVVSIDVKTSFWRQSCYATSGTVNAKRDPVSWAREVQERGAGEILLTSIDREGTWSGFDTALVRSVADAVSVPVIAQGGAGSVEDIGAVVKDAHAAAVALGSMVVFQKRGMGVLVNFPAADRLRAVLA